jgi:hypothetical protein
MTYDLDQTARDAWQSALYEVAHQISLSLKELHQINPWPEHRVPGQAINTLAMELWDRCFSLSEITTAFQDAATDLLRHAAGEEVRP